MPRKGDLQEVVGYAGAHRRVKRARGFAKEHACLDCGAPAVAWAYDHTDENALIGESAGKSVPYSLDIERYDPLCRSCHTRRDMGFAPAGFCAQGHPVTEETLYVDSRGWHSCKVCRKDARRRFNERNAA